MPSRAHSATPDSRARSGASSSEQSSRHAQKQKSSGTGEPVRRKTSCSKAGSSSQGSGSGRASAAAAAAAAAAASSLSMGFRIASTPPQKGKFARRESSGPNATPPTGVTATYKGGGVMAGGREGEACGSGSWSGSASGSSAKNICHLPNQSPKSRHRPVSASKLPVYKSIGSSSQQKDPEGTASPDPYLELTSIVNEEIRLKEHSDMIARTKMTVTNHALGSNTKGSGASQTPQSPSTGNVSASPVQTASATFSATGREGGGAQPESTASSKVLGYCCGRVFGNGNSYRSRAHSATPCRGKRPVAIGSDGGDGVNGGVGFGGGCEGQRAASSLPEKVKKQRKPRDSTPPEQEDEDDEDDETGMPQAVRLPEATAGETETHQEVLKRIHRTRMETIARDVEPAELMRHLSQTGYFRYDYSGHSRTTLDNHNLKNGQKKGVERLYLWLSMYSPPDVMATPKS